MWVLHGQGQSIGGPLPGGGYVFDLLVHPAGIYFDVMFDQRRNVLAARPQRRQRDREHIQSVVEIAAKFVALYSAL